MEENRAEKASYAGIREALRPGEPAHSPVVPPGGWQINDTELTYTGQWAFARLLPWGRFFCNTHATALQNGAEASYRFTGAERLCLYGMAGDGAGTLVVSVDGAPGALAAETEPSPEASRLLFDSGPLSAGPHTISVTAGEGAVLDSLVCQNGKGPYYIHNQNRAFVYYSAGFRLVPGASLSAGCLMAACGQGEAVEVYFKGPALRCYGHADETRLKLFVDGEARFVDETPPGAPRDALLFELSGLAGEAFHKVRVELASAGSLAVSHFEADAPDCLMTEMNRRTDAEIARMARHEAPAGLETWQPVALAARAAKSGVELGEGPFGRAFSRNIEYLQNAWALPGWVREKDSERIWVDILQASSEGRLLGGMGHTLRYREIPLFRQAIAQILRDVERRQFVNFNGYLMPYDSTNYKLWCDVPFPKGMRGELKNYDRAMFTKGMLAAGGAGFTEAYGMLREFYDWFNGAKAYLPLMLLDGMAIQGSIAGPLVYHSPAGTPRDVETNLTYYDMDWWLEYLAKGYPEAVWRFTLNRPHNYLLTSVCALFEVYRATGYQRYLDACLGAWQIYHNYFQIPGGGISIVEHYECRPHTYLLANLPNSVYETCGSVFWAELNHRLLQLWPQREMYAAEIEKSLYNIIFSAQGTNGDIRYFNHMNGEKQTPGMYNTCCEIQETHLLGQLPQYLYSTAENAVYLNLFARSVLEYEGEAGIFRIAVETDFPLREAVEIEVTPPREGSRLALHIRIPSWLEGEVVICLNGHAAATGSPGSYYALARAWHTGDRLTFSLLKAWRVTRYTGVNQVEGRQRYALEYGPLLMALCGPLQDGCLQGPNEPTIGVDMAPGAFLRRLVPTGEPLVFGVEGMAELLLKPYYEVQEEHFTCFPAFLAGGQA